MCLYTKWKKPKEAKKDIIVYKILDETRVSPIRGFVYNLGVKYDTNFEHVNSLFTNGRFINAGFHAFTSKRALLKSSLMKNPLKLGVAFKCIIPKGSSYYISSCKKEIVSDSIIIKRRLLLNRF